MTAAPTILARWADKGGTVRFKYPELADVDFPPGTMEPTPQ